MPGIAARLECRSEIDYPGRPLAVHWQGRRRTVEAVLASWRSPEEIGYRVVTMDGAIFDCCYSASEHVWLVSEIGQAGPQSKKEPQ